MVLGSWEERGERKGIVVVHSGSVRKSDEQAVTWLCDVSYTAMRMPLGG